MKSSDGRVCQKPCYSQRVFSERWEYELNVTIGKKLGNPDSGWRTEGGPQIIDKGHCQLNFLNKQHHNRNRHQTTLGHQLDVTTTVYWAGATGAIASS